MNQSAVDWLWDKLIVEGIPVHPDILENAKAIFKKQIMDAHIDGFADAYDFPTKKSAEEYYNENYQNK